LTNILEQIGAQVRAAADAAAPSVVGVGRGTSGVVVADGRVLTAAHATRRPQPTIRFADGASTAAEVLGVDGRAGVALLAADTHGLPAITWSGVAPRLGDAVIAIANPGGRGIRASLGFVTAARRSLRGAHGRPVEGLIEHGAPLPRGSSGAPLVDHAGQLVGINAIRADGGLILALPADADLRERLDALARGETTSPLLLGVAIAPPRMARRMRESVGLEARDGLLVREVDAEGPAGGAGVRRGDLLVSAAGEPLNGIRSLASVLDAHDPADPLPLTLVRGAEELALEVEFTR